MEGPQWMLGSIASLIVFRDDGVREEGSQNREKHLV